MTTHGLDSQATSVYRPRGWTLWMSVVGLLLALALSSLDATVVGTALPTIVGDLHGFAQYSWVVTAYLLTSTTVAPIVGKLSDQFGRKGFLLAGIGLFLLGSGLAGTAQTMTQLILFRGLQGFGAGFMQTLAFTLVADLFPPAERGRWQGIFISVLSLALIVGPAMGGAITDHATWRWVFYVNFPVGFLALLVLILWLPTTLATHMNPARGWAAVRRIDVPGVLTAASATVCLLLALTWGGTSSSWGSVPVVGLLIAAFVLALLLLFAERLVREPLLPPDLFRNRVFVASSLLALAGGMVIYAMIFYLPLFLQGVLGQTATNAGAGLAPLFILVAISSVLGGQMLAKVGRYQVLAVIGALLLVIGIFLLTRMDLATAFWIVTLDMIVVGVGLGIIQPTYTVAGQNALPPDRLGAGTGAMGYLRTMGSLIGTAVLGAIVAHSATSGHATHLSLAARQALAGNIAQAFLVTSGVAVAMLVISLFLTDRHPRTPGEGVPTRRTVAAISADTSPTTHIDSVPSR